MIRKLFKKKKQQNSKLDSFLNKYHIPREYFSVNRKSVTRAILIGLFVAMIPMPMQMVAVMFFIPFIRFNVPIGVAMVWISNPFTMPPLYYIEYITGNFLLMREGISDIQMSVEWFQHNLDDIFIPLYVGAFFYSFLIAGLGYYIINWCWIHSVKREKDSKIT